MQDKWLAFLQEQDATLQDNNIHETALASPLTGFTMLAVSGDDAHTFLHGQFINDLNQIEKPGAQLSAWCNVKGQVITNFLIINTGISYLLVFKKDQKEFVQKRLGMFVLRSKVTIEDVSETSPLVGIANTNDLSILTPNTPVNPGDITAHEGLIIVCHPDNSGRFLITGSIEALIKKLSDLKNILNLCSNSTWSLLDVLSGLPWITSRTQEQFLPQMLNLDTLNGMSYQKGCYPGQEVIARLHYKGQVKKRLQLIKTENALNVGDTIIQKETVNKVGTIINTEVHPDSSSYSLAVIELDKLNETLVSDNQTIIIQSLPYAIES